MPEVKDSRAPPRLSRAAWEASPGECATHQSSPAGRSPTPWPLPPLWATWHPTRSGPHCFDLNESNTHLYLLPDIHTTHQIKVLLFAAWTEGHSGTPSSTSSLYLYSRSFLCLHMSLQLWHILRSALLNLTSIGHIFTQQWGFWGLLICNRSPSEKPGPHVLFCKWVE